MLTCLMSLLEKTLNPPRYGFERDGILYHATHSEIIGEFFFRLNIFESKKNWLPLFSWVTSLSFIVPLIFFFTRYWSWKLACLGFVYSMVILGSHGTFWLHRYSTHRAFRFKNKLFRNVCRNLVIKIVPEEVYVISHHVHHKLAEKPGDPYNAYCGWLYCFLADVNHQGINRDLSQREYLVLCGMLEHTGVQLNSYSDYRKWGSLCHPGWTIFHYLINWSFWYLVFFLLGGHALATALFGFAGVWAIGIRTFNYEGHGRGKDRKRKGTDFNQKDISINQLWPGYVAGEWHNNHHLFPTGARSGFLPYQLDLPWIMIKLLHKIGIVSTFRDFKDEFFKKHYLPFKALSSKRYDPPATLRSDNHPTQSSRDSLLEP